MAHHLTHNHTEIAYMCRHEDIRSAGRLASSLQHAPMHRSHLIGVVAEVGGRSGVVKAEHAAYKQCALVMAGSEWSAESSACLAA